MSDKQILIVEVKSAYGQDRVYPVCDLAYQFVRLLGTTTFTERHMELIEGMGYEFRTRNGGLI